ncbi:MAG: DUF4143 domain-containing protein [Planctomycetaceae bacterium]|nr:DUF4143 domain-containing protein [Planctomycetaceae bacterium]
MTAEKVRILLDFFEQSMLIKVVKPFEHRIRNARECVKICLCDHAIRKARMKENIPLYGATANADMAGYIIEGIVGTFFSSVKNLGVSYFPADKNKSNEVDFILEIGDHHIPVEVKYSNNPNFGPGLKEFLNKAAYNAPFGLLITKDDIQTDFSADTKKIIPISVKRLLLLK